MDPPLVGVSTIWSDDVGGTITGGVVVPSRLIGGSGGTTGVPPPLTELGPWLRRTSITGTIFAISACICWISGLF